jgi:Cellulase M and related proteins
MRDSNLLEKLCNAMAVSGDEREVRSIVLEELKPVASEVKVDALGNVLVTRLGHENPPGGQRLRVMFAAHMDEVGFMLVESDDGGLFQFETVGGIDPRQLVGKSVIVGRDHLPGVIGAKPIHLTEQGELEQIGRASCRERV